VCVCVCLCVCVCVCAVLTTALKSTTVLSIDSVPTRRPKYLSEENINLALTEIMYVCVCVCVCQEGGMGR
jgi:hypothetical protein